MLYSQRVFSFMTRIKTVYLCSLATQTLSSLIMPF